MTAIEPDGVERVRVRLTGPGEEVVLIVQEATSTGRYLLRAGPFAFSHPSDKPLTSRTSQEALQELARALVQWSRAELSRRKPA